jgi:tellurite resistance protein TerC
VPAVATSAMPATTVGSVGSPALWAATIAVVIALLVADFVLTRRPHTVRMREAVAWSVVYLALPLAFAGYVWGRFGSGRGLEFVTGYLIERSLSFDNLFVFMLLLGAFAVPVVLQQRVLLYGVIGAMVLRGIFIALGAAALESLSFAFLLFGLVLLVTAVKLLRDARSGDEQAVEISSLRSVRLLRRFLPVTDGYDGTRLLARVGGRRALTPLAVVVVALFTTDIVFAVDSVPAVYGITADPYLVFATNAFALLGMRALYFVLHGAIAMLVHLSYGLAAILGFIGAKLVLHWAHGLWPSVPDVPTLPSLGVVVGILALVTVTSLRAARREEADGTGGADEPAAIARVPMTPAADGRRTVRGVDHAD